MQKEWQEVRIRNYLWATQKSEHSSITQYFMRTCGLYFSILFFTNQVFLEQNNNKRKSFLHHCSDQYGKQFGNFTVRNQSVLVSNQSILISI